MGSKKKADMNKFKVLIGYTFLFISLILITSFISYMFNWKVDQSNVENLFDRNIEVEKINASGSTPFDYKRLAV